MSPERHHDNWEHALPKHDQLEAARRNRLESLRTTTEDAEALNATERAAQAREAIHKPDPKPEAESAPETTAPRSATVFLDRKLNYSQTMKSLQHKLSPASRRFSQVVHAPFIEKTSEALEKTVARPSVTAGATWTALIVGSVFYFTARRYGYALSGSEMLFSFAVGAIIGLVLEALWRSLRHR